MSVIGLLSHACQKVLIVALKLKERERKKRKKHIDSKAIQNPKLRAITEP